MSVAKGSMLWASLSMTVTMRLVALKLVNQAAQTCLTQNRRDVDA